MNKKQSAALIRERRHGSGGSGLLHNMSTTPRFDIQHKSPFRRVNTRGIIFALPARADPIAELLAQVGEGETGPSSPGQAEQALRSRIDEHARTLPFPAAALVAGQAEPEDTSCGDLLTIAAVLAKSSGRVYLRDKTPNLNQIKPGRRVVLLVPEERKNQ